MPPKITVEFTGEEINATLQLLDTAVKAIGLRGAQAGLVIAQKLELAAQAAASTVPAPEGEAAPAPKGKKAA